MENVNKSICFTDVEKKRNSKNQNKISYVYFLGWTYFLLIPLTTLYNKYIDRPKLTEHEKNI